MNKVILIGRLTRDPEIRYSQGSEQMAVARYTLAVDRRQRKDNNGQTADFINCVCFSKNAEFAEKYLRQGIKIAIVGRIQTGSYTNRDGQRVFTTDIVVDEHEFVESKNASNNNNSPYTPDYNPNAPYQNNNSSPDGFMTIPEGIEDDLPFK